MARRPVAWVAAVVLILEALGVVLVNALLAEVVDNQHMSLAGLASDAMSRGAWVLGGLAAVYLVVCGVILVRTALPNRAPGRVGRIVLISCAVVHGVLAALAVGLLGWLVFVALVAVLALLVWVLVAYGTGDPEHRAAVSA